MLTYAIDKKLKNVGNQWMHYKLEIDECRIKKST